MCKSKKSYTFVKFSQRMKVLGFLMFALLLTFTINIQSNHQINNDFQPEKEILKKSIRRIKIIGI